MEVYQVIIVGSGPAGAACAKALRSEDIEALIIERDAIPRHKICSGILFGQAQVLLEKFFGSLPPDQIYCDPKIIKADCILEWNQGGDFLPNLWELPKNGQPFPEAYLNVWRKDFDAWLLQETGAGHKDNCVFNGCVEHKNKVRISVSLKNNVQRELYCSYLVGADGGNSPVRRIINPSPHQSDNDVVIYQTYY